MPATVKTINVFSLFNPCVEDADETQEVKFTVFDNGTLNVECFTPQQGDNAVFAKILTTEEARSEWHRRTHQGWKMEI